MSTIKLSFFFTVTTGSTYIGVPTSLKTKNDLDAHGVLLDLRRLPAETGVDYYKRLRGVIPQRAGAHQKGLVYGVTRELGLQELSALKITPVSINDEYTAPAPRIDVTSTKIILYSSYISSDDYEVDVEADIFDHGEGYLLEDLLEELQTSEYFEAQLSSYVTGKEKSNGLIPGSSDVIVWEEVIPSNTFCFLAHTNVVPGSLSFSNREVFDVEVSPEVADPVSGGISLAFSVTTPVVAEGQYFVDYKKGMVISYQAPPTRTTCRYVYRDFPWRIRWSPVAVYNIRDSYYREKVFEQEEMPDSSTQEGVVTDEGRAIYEIVFKRSSSLWGE